ncbi:MAG: Ig-like domain-containing protein [Gemmatimonadetes bacterium]|nr:Ig-like domain-containing protein [Gemmatimonadota bacterium]
MLIAAIAATGLVACSDSEPPVGPPPPPPPDAEEGEVFIDDFSEGLDWQPFLGSLTTALEIDESGGRGGTSALRFTVPHPDQGWTGGAFVANPGRDLSGYNALSFWVKGASAATINAVGFGNDNTGNSIYDVEVVGGVGIGTDWTQVLLGMPDPSVMTAEQGMFFFAEAGEGQANTIWIDDMQYVSSNEIGAPAGAMAVMNVTGEPGGTAEVAGTVVNFSGSPHVIGVKPSYFVFSSSDESVATVSDAGVITFVASGTATISATLAGAAVGGEVTVVVQGAPDAAAPTPTAPADSVISLFSDAYDDVMVDTWSADWDQADVEDIMIGDDAVKKYSNLVYAGIEFTSSVIDATDMEVFHFDMFTNDNTADPAVFKVKLVDFGDNGVWDGGGDDSEHLVTFTAADGLASGQWVGFDIMLDGLTDLAGRAHLAQLLFEGDPNTVYIDNIYFRDTEGGTAPGDVFVDELAEGIDFQFFGGQTGAMEVDATGGVDGSAALKFTVPGDGWVGGAFVASEERDMSAYSAIAFSARATTAASINAVGFGVDNLNPSVNISEVEGGVPVGTVWGDFWMVVSDPSRLTAEDGIFHIAEGSEGADNTFWFDNIRYVDDVAGSNPRPKMGVVDLDCNPEGTGHTVGHVIEWDLNGEKQTTTVASGYFGYASNNESVATVDENGLITCVAPGTAAITATFMGVDVAGQANVTVTASTQPDELAPTPTEDAADVISLYSDSYDDVTVDTWSAGWDNADHEEFSLMGESMHKYTNLHYAGIEFTTFVIDASGMTHFHTHFWTPDNTENAEFSIKLVDFGPDGAFGGGDDTESSVSVKADTDPAIETGAWITLEFELSAFEGLAGTEHLAQIVIESVPGTGLPNTVFLDNIYFVNKDGN